ncbi:718_t:CDS:1, partial [Cetraspora pellucida]
MSKPNKRKKVTLTIELKKEICLKKKKQSIPTPTNKDLAYEYSVDESTIHDILKQKDK